MAVGLEQIEQFMNGSQQQKVNAYINALLKMKSFALNG
jgi:hypothetical protein